MTDDQTRPGPLEALESAPIDDADGRALATLRRIYELGDPVPPSLLDRVKFAITLDDLEAEVARLQREAVPELHAARSEDVLKAQTVTFTSETLTTMVTITPLATNGVRIDGWVFCGMFFLDVELRDRRRDAARHRGRGRPVRLRAGCPRTRRAGLAAEWRRQGRSRGDHSRDRDLNRRGRRFPTTAARSLEQVEELRTAARDANNSGRPARGAAIVARALAMLDHVAATEESLPRARYLRARLLITQAFADIEIHGYARSAPVMEAASTAAAESGSLDAIALVHDLRGCLLLRNGDIEASLPEFDQAIALVGALAPTEQPSLFLNRGSAYLYRRDLGSARDDLRTSAELARQIGLTRVESKAMHNLGYAEYLAGNLPLALDTLARAHGLDEDVARAGLLDNSRAS